MSLSELRARRLRKQEEEKQEEEASSQSSSQSSRSGGSRSGRSNDSAPSQRGQMPADSGMTVNLPTGMRRTDGTGRTIKFTGSGSRSTRDSASRDTQTRSTGSSRGAGADPLSGITIKPDANGNYSYSQLLGIAASGYERDPEKATQLLTTLKGMESDRTSLYYKPYNQPTNPAVAALAALGVDVSKIDDDWFNANSYLKQYYKTTANTNGLSSTMTNKKASTEEKMAYYYNQLWMEEETTKKAERERDQLYNDLGYWASQADRNYSDKELLDRVDWSKYPTLKKMRESAAAGTPIELNRAVYFDDDSMQAVLWMARNPEYKGGLEGAMANMALGYGNSYTADAKIAAMRDKNSADYAPYTAGCTMDEERAFFGVPYFPKDWTEKNKHLLTDGTEEERRHYINVAEGEEITLAAESELEALYKRVDKKLGRIKTREQAEQYLDALLDSGEFPTLVKMDKTIERGYYTKDKDTLGLTRAVPYRKADMLAYMTSHIAGSTTQDDIDYADDAAASAAGTNAQNSFKVTPDGLEFVQPLEPLPENIIEGTASLDDIQKYADSLITEPEKPSAGASVPKENLLGSSGGAPAPGDRGTPGNVLEENRRKAFDEKHGEGEYDRVMALARGETPPQNEPSMSEQTAAIYRQQDETLTDGLDMADGTLTPSEDEYMDVAGSTVFEYVTDRITAIKDKGTAAAKNLATKSASTVRQSHTDAVLGSLQDIYDYETSQEKLDALRLREAKLLKQTEGKEYVGQERQDTVYRPIERDGRQYEVALGWNYWENTYMMESAEEIGANGDRLTVEPEDWMALRESDEVAKAVLDANEVATKIEEQNRDVTSLSKEDKQAAEDLRSIQLQIQDTEAYLAEHQSQYEAAAADFDNDQKQYQQSLWMLEQLGVDTSDLEKSEAAVGYLTQFHDYEATVWNNYNPSQMYAKAIEGGEDKAAVLAAAKQGDDELKEELDTALAVKEYIQESGLNVPPEYLSNLDRHIAKLQRNHQDYEFFALSDRKDFETVAQKGREIEFENRPIAKNIFGTYDPWNGDMEKYYADQMTDRISSEDLGVGLQAATMGLNRFMTKDELDTYYYLLGSGDNEKAQEYVRFMTDMSYGVLWTRQREQTEQAAREMTDAGFGGFLGSNALAVLMNPVAAITSAMYYGYNAATGSELNPDNGLLAANHWRTATREESAQVILRDLGTKVGENEYEENWKTKVAQAGYEIVSNRLDSVANQAVFGGLFGGAGEGASFIQKALSETASALPMGISASMDAAADAKRKGASDAQAYGVAAVTLFAETVTEGFSIDNMREAFELGSDIGADTVKDFLKNWLTKAGISEMAGESITDIIENYADENIMGELSDHADRVWDYRMKGMGKDEAEAAARKDELNGVLRTALISYLSPGLDIVSTGAGRYSYWMNVTREHQQAGDNRSVLEIMQGVKKARADLEDAGAVLDGSASQEALVSGYEILDNAKSGSETAKTAAVSAILNGVAEGRGLNSQAISDAAAVRMRRLMGGQDIVQGTQELVMGAAVGKVDSGALTQALQNAALSPSSEAAKVMKRRAYRNGTPETKAQMLAATVEADAKNPNVTNEIVAAVHENRVNEETKKQIAAGALNGARPAVTKSREAMREARIAESQLEDRQEERKAAQEAIKTANEAVQENPQEGAATMAEALNKLNSTSAVEQEYAQKEQKAKQKEKDAKEEANRAVAEGMSQIRAESETRVTVKEQAAAQAAADAEVLAQQQAVEAQAAQEAQEASDNALDADVDAFIEDNYADATDEEKQHIREMFAKNRPAESNPDSDRQKFFDSIRDKFGVNIEEADELEHNANGKYDPKTNTIILNKKATVGDALYFVLGHELTHITEQAGEYNQLADSILGLAFGKGTTYQGILDDMKAGRKNSPLARMVNARRATYERATGESYGNDYYLQEIVADNLGMILRGDPSKPQVQQDLINRLVAEEPTTARKILDGIKSFLKRAVGMRGAWQTDMQNTVDLFTQALSKAQKGKQGKKKFSLTSPTEQLDNGLVATHTTTYNSLLRMANFSGIPAPSIAVAQSVYTVAGAGYGEISFVFRPETIDPGADSNNRVYGRDAYTPTFPHTKKSLFGNRFQENNKRVTAQNAVELMRNRPAKSGIFGEDFMASGTPDFDNSIDLVEHIIAEFSKDYHSIEEIQADRSRLGQNSYGEILRDLYGARGKIDKLKNRVISEIQATGRDPEQIYGDASAGKVNDLLLAFRAVNSGTEADIKALGLSDQTVQDIRDFISETQKGITSYAEAKPMRVVGWNEIAEAILPKDAPQEVIDFLQQHGIKMEFYTPGSDADRRNVLNNSPIVKDAKFSLADEESTTDEQVAQVLTDRQGNETAAEVLPGNTVALDETKFSLNSFNESEQERTRAALLNIRDDSGKRQYTPEQVDKYMQDALGIAAMIAQDRGRLDFEATDNPSMRFLKDNQDYYYTLDASTLCAKRLLYQGTFNYVQHALPDEVFLPGDLIELVNIMNEMGYEVPCGICYVESRRRWLDKYTNEFLTETLKNPEPFIQKQFKTASAEEKAALRERLSPERLNAEGGTPSIDDLTTTDGLENVRKNDPYMYKAFVAAMNAKGSANPKVVQPRTEYKGEVASQITDEDVQKLIDIGGLRIQSFSDFETPHLLDMIQAVYDMAARGLTSQAYTKVPNFAWVFGDTGIKINLSLIGKGRGVDDNGNLMFDNKEGMDFDEAMRLRDRYNKNVGTILVGINDDHIIAAMGDPRIDFIIPFHQSGWSEAEMKGVSTLQYYEDFTAYQNEQVILGREEITKTFNKKEVSEGEAEKWIKNQRQKGKINFVTEEVNGKTTIRAEGYKLQSFKKEAEEINDQRKAAAGRKLKQSERYKQRTNFTPVGANYYWDFNLSGQANAEKYLQMCAEDGRMPKFWEFLVDNGDGSFSLPQGDDKRSTAIREGYWKTLTDFKMYENDGYGRAGGEVRGAAQQKVTPNINMDQAHRVMNEYTLNRPSGNENTKMVDRKSNNDVPVATTAAEGFIRRIRERRAGRPLTPAPNDPMEAVPEINVTPGSRMSTGVDPNFTGNGTAAGAYTGDMTGGNTPVANTEDFAAQQQNAMAVDAETGETVGRRYSLPSIESLEQEYAEAIRGGNEDWQRQLVQQAAFNAGYTTGAYHGSPETNIDEFNTRSEETKKQKLQLLFGTHFTRDRSFADIYAKKAKNSKGTSRLTTKTGRVYDSYLDLGKSLDLQTAKNYTPDTEMYQLYEDLPANIKKKHKPYTFSAYDTEQGLGSGNFITASIIEDALQDMSPKDATEFLVSHGYNSVQYMANYNAGMANNRFGRDPSIIMLDPERIKSADPVTYDDQGNQIPLSERFNRQKNSIRYSLPNAAEMDEQYEAAYDNYDDAAAEELVRQAAEAAMPDSKIRDENGNLKVVYHQTNAVDDNGEPFTVFDPERARTSMDIQGIYFAPEYDENHEYGDRTYPVYLDIKNPAIDPQGPDLSKTDDGARVMRDLIAQGYDGIINTEDGKPYEYVAFYPEQIKSAEAFTEDDDGNLIYLSERFNTQNKDIRYSLPADAPYMAAVERGEMDQAQQMVDEAAREAGYTDRVYHGTDAFGFTQFNTDNIFVSYGSPRGASTYATGRNSGVRQIGTNDRLSRALQAMQDEGGDIAGLAYNPDTEMYDYTENTSVGPMPGELTEQDIDNYAGRDQSGVYQLRANPGNQLVIEGNGANWNEINAPMISDEPVSTNDIAEWARDNGYDSVRINGIYDTGENGTGYEIGDVGIFFNPNDVKSVDPVTYDDQGNVIPLSERFNTASDDIRYQLPDDSVLEQQIREYLANGGRLNRPTTPATPDRPQKQRQYGSQRAEGIPLWHDETIRHLKENSAYDPDANQEQVDRAFNWIQSHATEDDPTGYYGAVQALESDDFNFATADGQAQMIVTMAMAAVKAENGDQGAENDEMRLNDVFNRQGTSIAQALQARQIYFMLTPKAKQHNFQREIDKINNEYKRKGKKTRVELPQNLMNDLVNAKTDDELDAALKAARKNIASQMPANWREKLQAWRMFAMLANTRTHIRNILGNFAFMPVVGIKNKVGAFGEIITGQKTRTKTIGLANKEARAFAKDDAKKMEADLRGEKKYSEGSKIQQERKAFGQGKGFVSRTLGKGVQAAMDFSSNMLEQEDWIFLQRHYRNALAGYMTANKLTAADMKGKTLNEARAYAINEAQKATYRDANEIANWMNSLKNPVGKFVVNAALPFKKTPMNILKRGIEYSPAGLFYSAARGASQVRSGKITVNEYIDKISAGLTGTGIMALGAILSAIGAASGGLDDDDDEFDKLQGEQEYAINPGKAANAALGIFGVPKLFGEDVSYTIDWAAPSSMPFFVGAAIMDTYKNQPDITIPGVLDAILGITEPVFNLSMLEGVNSLIDVSRYAEGDAFTQVGEKLLTNYVSSYVPSAVGQVARTRDTTRRKSYVESGADLSTFRYAWEGLENKLLYLSTTNIPYRDVWGNAETSSTGEAFIENFISPGYANQIKNDPVTAELKRIYNAEGVTDENRRAVVPKAAGKTIGSTKLNAEQYDQYVVSRGQAARQTLEGLMESPFWQISDDNSRAKMVKDAWTYANQIGQNTVTGRKLDAWVLEAQTNGDVVKTIVSRTADSNREDYITNYSTSLAEAIDNDSDEDIDTCMAALEDADADPKEIRAGLRNYFKPLYQKAYMDNDDDRMEEISDDLILAGVGFKSKDFLSWVPGTDEEEDEINEDWLNR